MRKLRLALLLSLAALAIITASCLGDLPLMPARRSTITLLYTGDARGHVAPCSG